MKFVFLYGTYGELRMVVPHYRTTSRPVPELMDNGM